MWVNRHKIRGYWGSASHAVRYVGHTVGAHVAPVVMVVTAEHQVDAVLGKECQEKRRLGFGFRGRVYGRIGHRNVVGDDDPRIAGQGLQCRDQPVRLRRVAGVTLAVVTDVGVVARCPALQLDDVDAVDLVEAPGVQVGWLLEVCCPLGAIHRRNGIVVSLHPHRVAEGNVGLAVFVQEGVVALVGLFLREVLYSGVVAQADCRVGAGLGEEGHDELEPGAQIRGGELRIRLLGVAEDGDRVCGGRL